MTPAAPAEGEMAGRDDLARVVKWAEVDADVLEANAASVVARVGASVAVMAIVKANGYGHGAVTAAHAFIRGGARALGVSSADEAIRLREAGIAIPILVLGWSHPGYHRDLIAAGVDLTVYAAESIRDVARSACRAGARARIQLKVDTGTGRLGASPAAVGGLLDLIADQAVDLDLTGFFTHFADADGQDLAFTMDQHRRFAGLLPEVRARFPGARVHCSNSAATVRCPEMHHDLVRPGLLLYGYQPGPGQGSLSTRPAMAMYALVTNVKTVEAGETVGYARLWTASRPTRIATIAAGYADGVHLAQSNRGSVLLGGARCPIVGRVSMDQITVDASAAPRAGVGDRAVFFGRQGGAFLSIEEVARAGATIAYEVLCSVSARVPRGRPDPAHAFP